MATIYDKIPSAVLFQGVRYRTDGLQMLKDVGLSSFAWGIPKPASLPSAADASTGNLEAGVYKIHMVAENKWGYIGNPRTDGPVSVTLADDDHKIALTNIPTFNDPQVAYVRFYITYPDTTSPFYYAGAVANGTSSLNITAHHANWPTTDLLEPGYLSQDYQGDLAGPYRYAVPICKRYVAVFDDRIFCAGERVISSGLVSATDGSAIMTGNSQVSLNSTHVGKWITLHNENIAYEIQRVYTPQRWELTRNYETPSWRSADPTSVQYTLTGNTHQVVFSEQGEPEYFPSINSMNVGRDEGGALTGLRALGTELLCLTDRSIHAIYLSGATFQPYGVRKTHSPVGCTAYRSAVVAQGAMFFWGGNGFWVYSNNTAVNISEARLGEIYRDMNADLVPYIVGAYHDDKIFWAVPYNDDTYLDRLLIYDLRSKEWDLPWKTLQVIDMMPVVSTSGRHHLLFNQPAGDKYHLLYFDKDFYNDGAYNADYSGTVDSATSNTLTDASASFPTGGAGLAGVPVYIADGTGNGQERRVQSNTATTLTMTEPWTTIPSTDSDYLVGAVRGRAKSGKNTVGRPHDEKTFIDIEFNAGDD